MAINTKEEILNNEIQIVKKISDKLGKRVDRGIVEIVAVLRAWVLRLSVRVQDILTA